LFVILDVYGTLFFAPGFSDFDYFMLDASPGESEIEVLPEFIWPAGTGQAASIRWLAALTNPDMTALTGSIGEFTFSWGN